jgi:hypothetical protein
VLLRLGTLNERAREVIVSGNNQSGEKNAQREPGQVGWARASDSSGNQRWV